MSEYLLSAWEFQGDESKGQLSFGEGVALRIIPSSDAPPGWSKGEHVELKTIGFFPLNYTEPHPNPSSLQSNEQKSSHDQPKTEFNDNEDPLSQANDAFSALAQLADMSLESFDVNNSNNNNNIHTNSNISSTIPKSPDIILPPPVEDDEIPPELPPLSGLNFLPPLDAPLDAPPPPSPPPEDEPTNHTSQLTNTSPQLQNPSTPVLKLNTDQVYIPNEPRVDPKNRPQPPKSIVSRPGGPGVGGAPGASPARPGGPGSVGGGPQRVGGGTGGGPPQRMGGGSPSGPGVGRPGVRPSPGGSGGGPIPNRANPTGGPLSGGGAGRAGTNPFRPQAGSSTNAGVNPAGRGVSNPAGRGGPVGGQSNSGNVGRPSTNGAVAGATGAGRGQPAIVNPNTEKTHSVLASISKGPIITAGLPKQQQQPAQQPVQQTLQQTAQQPSTPQNDPQQIQPNIQTNIQQIVEDPPSKDVIEESDANGNPDTDESPTIDQPTHQQEQQDHQPEPVQDHQEQNQQQQQQHHQEQSKSQVSVPVVRVGRAGSTAEPICKVRAIYDYPGNPDHKNILSFLNGEIIDVLVKNTNGWWTGRIGEVVGYFPMNFIEELQPSELEALSPPPQIASPVSSPPISKPNTNTAAASPSIGSTNPSSAASSPHGGGSPVSPVASSPSIKGQQGGDHDEGGEGTEGGQIKGRKKFGTFSKLAKNVNSKITKTAK